MLKNLGCGGKHVSQNAHAQVAKAYILYRDEICARLRDQRENLTYRSSQNIPLEKIWQVLDWAATL